MAVKSKSKSRKPGAKRAARGKRSAGKQARARTTGKAVVRGKAARRGKAKDRSGAKAKAKARERARAEKASKKERARREKQQKLAKKLRERKAAESKREREAALKKREQERARARKEKERADALKLRERKAAENKREREAALKKKEQERARARKEKERADALKLRERKAAENKREREAALKKKALEALLKQKEKERARLLKEREAQKAAALKAREAEKIRLKAEREAARLREKQEREAERERIREDARRKKEEERAKREAEREAYRKAKEAEQARLRAEKEAARRALEGRVVRATRASRAAQGGRLATTTRVYTPSSIPDQSGTRRSGEATQDTRFANMRAPQPVPPNDGPPGRGIQRTLPPPPPAPPPATVEERYARINERLAKTEEAFRREYEESFLMSWIYHDSALEGVVYTYEELRMAINPNISVVPDSSLQTVCDEIRRHKAAIEFVKEQAEKKRVPITIDTLKRIYLVLHPEEGDLKTVKYRKDIPQHRLYFHEYAPPDKIAYKVRQVFDWLNGPEPKKIKNAIRIASRAHYDLVRVFPFANDSGKASRLFMNLLLMRADCPPAIVHSTERQRYYEALRGQLPVIVSMVTEAITNALASIEKKLDERDTKLHPFG